MPYFRRLRLYLTFYKSFLPASAAITACCLGLYWTYGISILTAVLWLKVITMALIYRYINRTKQAAYHYYHNLGLSKRGLWLSTLTADFCLLLILLIQLHHLR